MNRISARCGKSVLGGGSVFSKWACGLIILSSIMGGVQSAKAAGYIFGGLTWTSVSNMPAAKIRHATATVDGNIYAIGGAQQAFGPSVSTVYTYDPLQPAQGWGSISNLPNNIFILASASVNNKIYALGGAQIPGWARYSSVYMYDPQQPTQGWGNASNMPASRQSFGAASVNGKLYAIGGNDGSNDGTNSIVATVYVYDPQQPAQGWLSVSNLPVRLQEMAVAVAGGKIYVIGGNTGYNVHFTSVYIYDPQEPTLGWLSVSNLPSGLSLHAATTVKWENIFDGWCRCQWRRC